MVRTCLTPEAGQPERPVSDMSILWSSRLPHLPGEAACRQHSATDGEGKWEEAGGTGSIIVTQYPAGFVPSCSVCHEDSGNQEEQFWSGNPDRELSLTVRKEVLCLCSLWQQSMQVVFSELIAIFRITVQTSYFFLFLSVMIFKHSSSLLHQYFRFLSTLLCMLCQL